MQNRYVGDIGDYVKLAILRGLVSNPVRSLGVVWWLVPDESHNGDGRHIGYLDRPDKWRRFDSEVFDALQSIKKSGKRHVSELERLGVLPGAVFFSKPVPVCPVNSRAQARYEWLHDAKLHLEQSDVVFCDPDNGLASEKITAAQSRAGKSVLLDDLQIFQKHGRALVLYHHQTRMKGGYEKEFPSLCKRLEAGGFRVNGALRAKPWSARLFLLIDGDEQLCRNAKHISDIWGEKISWKPWR